MNLSSFVHDLHFDIDRVRPPDVEVDWGDAPLAFKLYRDQPTVSLSAEVPLVMEGAEQRTSTPDLLTIGHFLWYTFGLTQFTQSISYADGTKPHDSLMHMLRRYAPSGGALYPNELYLYLRLEGLSPGVYHYDVAHHRLVLLREGNCDAYIAKALGGRCDLSACFGVALVSTMFWKNFFKYRDFAYRLQGLDTGVLMGQLLEVAKRFGFTTGVLFQFLDVALNHLLGLTADEESVYAAIPLSIVPPQQWFRRRLAQDNEITATELCQTLPAIRPRTYTRSKQVSSYPRLVAMNQASMLESFVTNPGTETTQVECNFDVPATVQLPWVKRMTYDFAAACRRRYSPGLDFTLRGLDQIQVAALLQEASVAFQYSSDLGPSRDNSEGRVSLYGCFVGVEDIPDGAYRYDPGAHLLQQTQRGDFRVPLQQAMSMHTVNLFQVPLCLHVVGHSQHRIPSYGFRGYRIAQMEAGMLVQRVLLTAAGLGLGGHPLLGFDTAVCDEIYRLTQHGQTSLIQLPIGSYRTVNRLEGHLYG